ncbi:MAG: hypothetical protein M1814_002338 [Vezdaea aestivalis]|nr:MAG: hypothetical protein M1814_002338 [Vezdaea aestivalis]
MAAASALPPEVEASYATIIDSILAASDITTVSAKQIRRGLQQAVTYDLTPQKDLIKHLIIARFDKFHNAADAKKAAEKSKVTNGADSISPDEKPTPSSVDAPNEDDEGTPSDSFAAPKEPLVKKKRKSEGLDGDARLAAKLQALENNKARPTRGGGSKKALPAKKRKANRVKSKSKVSGSGDSEVGSDDEEGPKRKVNRSGGFHKPYNLSAPLAHLLGESALSRPEVVKQIWAYVKSNDLQSQNDKRFIECDEALRTVFKQDKRKTSGAVNAPPVSRQRSKASKRTPVESSILGMEDSLRTPIIVFNKNGPVNQGKRRVRIEDPAPLGIRQSNRKKIRSDPAPKTDETIGEDSITIFGPPEDEGANPFVGRPNPAAKEENSFMQRLKGRGVTTVIREDSEISTEHFVVDTPDRVHDPSLETAWYKSLKPYQQPLGKTLSTITEGLVRQLNDKATAIDDIIEEYQKGGGLALRELEATHKALESSSRDSFRYSQEALTENYLKLLRKPPGSADRMVKVKDCLLGGSKKYATLEDKFDAALKQFGPKE